MHTRPKPDEWCQWKSQQLDIVDRIELNYDLLSLFNVDITKAIGIKVYIQATDLISGQDRIIHHRIPIFTHDTLYDIRPLEFEAGISNEFEVIAKRPDGKPAKMEDLIVTVSMIVGNAQGKVQEEQQVEIKDFYTQYVQYLISYRKSKDFRFFFFCSGRNDIGLFNIQIPQSVIGVLMTVRTIVFCFLRIFTFLFHLNRSHL